MRASCAHGFSFFSFPHQHFPPWSSFFSHSMAHSHQQQLLPAGKEKEKGRASRVALRF